MRQPNARSQAPVAMKEIPKEFMMVENKTAQVYGGGAIGGAVVRAGFFVERWTSTARSAMLGGWPRGAVGGIGSPDEGCSVRWSLPSHVEFGDGLAGTSTTVTPSPAVRRVDWWVGRTGRTSGVMGDGVHQRAVVDTNRFG